MLPTGRLRLPTKRAVCACLTAQRLSPFSKPARKFWCGRMRLCILCNTLGLRLCGVLSFWATTSPSSGQMRWRWQTACLTGWAWTSSTNMMAASRPCAVTCAGTFLTTSISPRQTRSLPPPAKDLMRSGGSTARQTPRQLINTWFTTTWKTSGTTAP